MNVRPSIVLFVSVVVVLIGLLLWVHNKKPEQIAITKFPTNGIPASSAAAHVEASSAAHPSTRPVPVSAPNGNSVPQPLLAKEQQMRQELSGLNNEDIMFNGRVVDQFASPVPGAIVSATVQVNDGARVGADKISLTTDANGFFTVSGYKGKTLGLWVTKPGYVMAMTNTSFVYSLLWPTSQRYVPDANNPTVIKMWKLQGAEPLVNINQNFKIPFTSGPISFDLLAGKVVPRGGDVTITVNRPNGQISEQNPQKWNINLEIPSGGFIQTSDKESAVTFAAPDNGYQSNGSFENNNGPNLIDRAFFIESRNGQVYSKVRLLFSINNNPDGLMDISSTGVANVNGSRNWEATAPQ
jgi:hypothetical protein